jgi:hypothetical protein
MSYLFFLLILFQIKHWIADYPLQGRYMLGKFLPGWEFLGPLNAHCLVHAGFTILIVIACGRPDLVWLGGVDYVLHFTMDRIKAGPKYLGRFKALSASEMRGILSLVEMGNDPKAHPEIRLAAKNSFEPKIRGNTYFWWSLGIDQMVHHLTHYLIIWFMVTK